MRNESNPPQRVNAFTVKGNKVREYQAEIWSLDKMTVAYVVSFRDMWQVTVVSLYIDNHDRRRIKTTRTYKKAFYTLYSTFVFCQVVLWSCTNSDYVESEGELSDAEGFHVRQYWWEYTSAQTQGDKE